jgi:hypothetical protein
MLITKCFPNIHHDISKFHKYWKLSIACIHPLTHWKWVNAPMGDKEKLKYLSFKERPPCQFDNGYIVYGSKNILSSFKFYIPFLLVATKCNIVDYWFLKTWMKGPKFNLNYKWNYQNFTQGTLMPIMNKNQ